MKTHVKIQGTPNSPHLILSHSLGTTMEMWDRVVPLLLPYYRVVRYDTRGHGGSDIPLHPYTIEALGRDVIELMDSLNIKSANFCGLSMGGLIGQWLGIHYPNRIQKLVLCNTAAKIGTDERWNERIELIKLKGMGAVVESAIERWFTASFVRSHPTVIAEMKEVVLDNSDEGYINCCTAIRDADFRETLHQIPVDTLVLTGSEDPVTTVGHAREMVAGIPDAQLSILPTRHLSATEAPLDFAQVLIDFLVGPGLFEKGRHVRKSVLGQDHVEAADRKINSFNRDFQTLITDVPWGSIWTRPGLSKHHRSLITLAMMIALNRPAEFRMHIKAALHNGVTVSEIKEVILQSAIYCGFPAANEAFRHAEEVLTESGIGRD